MFVCLAYYLDRGSRRKLDPKDKKREYIGYAGEQSLAADGSRDKISGESKKRDIQ